MPHDDQRRGHSLHWFYTDQFTQSDILQLTANSWLLSVQDPHRWFTHEQKGWCFYCVALQRVTLSHHLSPLDPSQVQQLGQHCPLRREHGCPAASQEQNPPAQQQTFNCFQLQPQPAGQRTPGPSAGQWDAGRRPPGCRRPGRAVQPNVCPRYPENLW